ncbi:MAG: bifunctional (p)ppGpp synthetase/guanosine-3',5'-bis(diphosphate) 3'-pyrophosphohydrolase [Alphaproteobacteria bacterium]|nr:bifunctional (p)ppGpp synthetase/guanosine-3',5'-bis(diphosphate) 3'-pyrophosphohydrolase [Alphaproteobacteria bacterium]
MMRQYELVERVRGYDPGADEDLLNRAYVYTMKAHGTQKRVSGDPYFSHPIEVAGILADYRLDSASIVTALLHDTVEDTLATLEDIERAFGPQIAQLVDGVTKLSRLELPEGGSRQAENFRKLFLAMSNDIRVLLVKLADRLHNMRTLHFIKDEAKRRRIAKETMEIYVPLAERIGMQQMKEELESLAFRETNPDAHASILARLDFLRAQGTDLMGRIAQELQATLQAGGVAASVTGREKRPLSIWRKMERKAVSFEQLSDVMAFRIVCADSEPAICYRALGLVHARYPMVPGLFKDYISTPKRNGYRSLHTSVIGPEKHRIEVQIRTEAMHQTAELGVAAHWQYKQPETQTGGTQYRWIRELLEILEHASSPEEFLENTKLEMFQDQVFCFSPKGGLIVLPRGATPVDFAYAVHSGVGDSCVGCKINGRMMPLRSRLENGDQVEILRSKTPSPSPTWLDFVVTGRARSAIRRFIRARELEQYEGLGKAIVQKAFRQEGHEFSDPALATALSALKLREAEDLYIAVGKGDLTGRQVLEAVMPQLKQPEADPGKVVPLAKARGKRGEGEAVPIKGLIPGMALHFAGCCHPLPGDRIVGVITTGRGVTIHTIDCEQLEQFNDQPERWLDVAWDEAGAADPKLHVGRIHAVLGNEPGSLASLTAVIAKNQGNISNLKIVNRTPEFFEMVLDIEVANLRHLTNIIAALRATAHVHAVERARN